VLTLTARPSAHPVMSLTGVREPEQDDTPLRSACRSKRSSATSDEALVRQAILRELDRNGQVYFVHNPRQGIEQMAARVAKLVPERALRSLTARCRNASWSSYAGLRRRRIRLLGLPPASSRADWISPTVTPSSSTAPTSSALHSSTSCAAAWDARRSGLCVSSGDKHKTLTEDVRRRLEAIQEHSELGAGLRIAMQDLEIRGAGELLGARQHGHVAAVGFDLYTRLVEAGGERGAGADDG